MADLIDKIEARCEALSAYEFQTRNAFAALKEAIEYHEKIMACPPNLKDTGEDDNSFLVMQQEQGKYNAALREEYQARIDFAEFVLSVLMVGRLTPDQVTRAAADAYFNLHGVTL